MKAPLAVRFARHVDTNGPTPIACPHLGPCHIWTGTTMKQSHGRLPYGKFKIDGKMRYSHIVSFEIHNGPVPDGLIILHARDVAGCVNPAHLSAGTLSQNLKDAHARGRRAKRAA